MMKKKYCGHKFINNILNFEGFNRVAELKQICQ